MKNRANPAHSFSPSWGQSFAYDGFGNLTNTNVIKGSAPSMAATYDANNHAGGEDANGNPGYVPAPAQGASVPGAYDVENRVVSLNIHSLMNYSYDPDNKRVWRGNNGNGTDEVTFWSISGRKMGTYNITQSGSTLYCTQSGVNLYFGGKLIKNASGRAATITEMGGRYIVHMESTSTMEDPGARTAVGAPLPPRPRQRSWSHR